MLQERGRVVAVQDESVWVETIRRSTCGSCSARQGCGNALLNRHVGGGRGLVRALSGPELRAADCRVGDEVVLELPEEVILRGSLLVYMLPLLCMLGGALFCDALFAAASIGNQWSALAGASAGLVLGLALVRWHAWRHRADPALQPTLAHRVAATALYSTEVNLHV